MRFRLIEDQRDIWPVRVMCDALSVSPSGFYAWRSQPESARKIANRELLVDIRRVHAEHRGRYGAPRIHAELRAEGQIVSRKRIERVMHRHGIRAHAPRRYRVCTTDSKHALPIAANLLDRNFVAEKPDQIWLADITYIPTGEGWLYLAAVRDLATREIVGWSMADHLGAGLACDALLMAIRRRQPPRGLIHHSDRGVQYASRPYRAILARHGIVQSMSRKGNCLDNAPMESFFGSLKNELVHRTTFPTREAARRAIFEYVEAFYNRRRRHSGLGFLTPAQAHEQMAGAA
jgi:transposase InsO family protein